MINCLTLPGPGVVTGFLTGAGFTGFGVIGVGIGTGLDGGVAGFKGAGVCSGPCGCGCGDGGFWATGCGGTKGFALMGIGAGPAGCLGGAAPPPSMLMKARLAFLSSGG